MVGPSDKSKSGNRRCELTELGEDAGFDTEWFHEARALYQTAERAKQVRSADWRHRQRITALQQEHGAQWQRPACDAIG
jgi:hypothetical protein